MDKKFYSMIAEAAFSNPFSEERMVIDRRIVGSADGAGWDDILLPLLQTLEQHLQELMDDPVERDNLRGELQRGFDGSGHMREEGISILFFVFHCHMKQFDALIEEQIAAGDESCEAPFVLECMQRLVSYGFKRQHALQIVSVFYQVRRAYYFISNGLTGESPCMKQFRAQLWNNVFTHDIAWYVQCLWNRMEDFSTLLLGETGTGKGAAAAAIGRSGYIPYNPARKKFEESFMRAFISINLSQYPESLIESELFGHRKGAFTGAIEQHDGIFARCSTHGAIFLDEIGDVSAPIQIKLLQVLQERTFSPVGSHDKVRFKGRVIAATNKSVNTLRREGVFRDDFYYRLCSDIITVPPLRQRIREKASELESLATLILQRICGAGKHLPVVEKLKEVVSRNYAWPGNVRELEQAIRRIMMTGTYEGDLSDESDQSYSLESALEEGNLSARELVEKYCCDLYETYGNYGEVARRTGLDWRTVKKNVTRDL